MEHLNLSPQMIDFTRRLLHPDPTRRPTAMQALKHPWLEQRTVKHDSVSSRPPSRVTPIPVIRRPSMESPQDEEPLEHNVAEAINKRAYTRLLRWIDASHVDDESDAEESTPHRRQHYRRASYQYTTHRETEFAESREDIVVHARMAPKGQQPEVLTPMGSVSAEEGSNVVLRCAVHLPRPRNPTVKLDRMEDLKIKWSLNGRELTLPAPSLKLKQDPTGRYNCAFNPETGDVWLQICQVNTFDMGTYEVTVTGQYGEVSESANLKVYGTSSYFYFR